MYLDFNLGVNIPEDISIFINASEPGSERSTVSAYIDNGTGFEHIGSPMFLDGEVLIFGDTCQGILLVGEPIKNPGISTNTVLYAAIATIIVVVSVFLAVFVAKSL